MNTLTSIRKEIVEALNAAIDRENLPNREAAKFLNFHPCYISMAKNPNSWDSMSAKVWSRLEEWLLTRDKISSFKIPEGEPIYTPAERYSGERREERGKTKDKRQKSKQSEDPERIVGAKDKSEGEKEVVDISLKADGSKLAGFRPVPIDPIPEQKFTDMVRLKVALDIEINLVVNGQKVQLR